MILKSKESQFCSASGPSSRANQYDTFMVTWDSMLLEGCLVKKNQQLSGGISTFLVCPIALGADLSE